MSIDNTTGVNAGEGTQPAVAPPATEIKGDKPIAPGPPTDASLVVIDDLTEVVEKDNKKWVPLEALTATRSKLKELKERVEGLEKPPEPQVEGSDWLDKLFATPTATPTPAQPTQPVQPTQPAPVSPSQIQQVNEYVTQLANDGKIMEAFMVMENVKENIRAGLQADARSRIDGYDDLPLQKVSLDQVSYFQNNPEALKGLIAKVRFGNTKPQTAPQVAPVTTPQTANMTWEQQKQYWIEEGKRQGVNQISTISGMSGERPGGSPPMSGDADVLSADATAFYKGLGYTDEQLKPGGEIVKMLRAELDRVGRF